MHLQILDLDGALNAQTSLHAVAPWDSISTIALLDLAPRLRLWSRERTMRAARARIHAQARAEPTLNLLGSGDFHHLAVLLMETAREPVTIVHIDNHPDWVRLAPRWHCGSWVNQALRLPQVRRVITLGVCSDDLVRPDLKGGNLPALADGRIVLLPWQHAPSRVLWRVADGLGHRYERGHLVWTNLAEIGVGKALDAIISRVETPAIWLSIDKDVLAESEALTNWDQGQMPLAALVQIIAAAGAQKRIVGADICGDFSATVHANWLKRWEAHRDQPQRVAAADKLARNEATNRELLVAIAQAARR
jgi:arginase family enzyme